MRIDFEKCRVVVNPTGKLANSMYTKLWHMFPYDRPIYEQILDTGKKFFTMKNYALFKDEIFLGNCGLFPVSIWLEGKPCEVIGVGAVATVPEYRRQGIAGYLLKHCMRILDEQKKPSVLFTELASVYQEHGFETVEQYYRTVSPTKICFKSRKFNLRYFEQISTQELQKMREVYEKKYPNFDGKVVRTMRPDYWEFYQMYFNLYLRPRLVWAMHNNELSGYMRFEVEKDRLIITEFCTGTDDVEVTDSLLAFISDFAKLTGYKMITLVLMQDHFVWERLRQKGMEIKPEPEGEGEGISCEIFMVRHAVERRLGPFTKLQWSLADKF